MTLLPESQSIINLLSQFDKDGFIPLTSFISKLTPDDQRDEKNVRIIKRLSKTVNFDLIFNKNLQENALHPLIV